MRIQFKFEICVCTDENNDKNKKNLPPVPFFPLQLLTVSWKIECNYTNGLFFTADLLEVCRKKVLILWFLKPSPSQNEVKYFHNKY